MSIKDISEFHQAAGRVALRQMLESAERVRDTAVPAKVEVPLPSAAASLPAIISAIELSIQDVMEPPQLIHGILHQGSKMVLGGGSKSFRTWSLLDLAMSVASGKAWWGFQTTQTKVLYINLELPDWSFRHRLSSIRSARPELGLKNLDTWNLRGHAVAFEQMRPAIVERIQQGYGLIIIDPIYKVYGNRDENSAGDMGTLLNEIESLAVKTGAAVVFGAHFSKGNQSGKESIDRISGSGVFARDPDSILIMTRHETEDAFTVDATLRNFKPIESFCVERLHPLMVRNDGLDPMKLKQSGFKSKYSTDQLLDVLGEQSLTTGDWYLKTAHKTGMSKRTFMDKLKHLKQDGTKVTYDAKEKWSKSKKEIGAEVQ